MSMLGDCIRDGTIDAIRRDIVKAKDEIESDTQLSNAYSNGAIHAFDICIGILEQHESEKY